MKGTHHNYDTLWYIEIHFCDTFLWYISVIHFVIDFCDTFLWYIFVIHFCFFNNTVWQKLQDIVTHCFDTFLWYILWFIFVTLDTFLDTMWYIVIHSIISKNTTMCQKWKIMYAQDCMKIQPVINLFQLPGTSLTNQQ